MKILLIAPQYKPRGQFYELPLGISYVSSYLKSKGLEVNFVNLNERDLAGRDINAADIVATGGLSVHYQSIKALLQAVKTINPRAKTVVGGGLFSSEPELMFEMLAPNIDIGVQGEGEKVLYDIATNLPWAVATKGIEALPIMELDELPFPDYEGLGVRAYLDRQLCGDEHYLYAVDKPRCLPVISSRSCPHNCSFCFHPLGKIYRQRSLNNFFSEIEFLIEKYQINMVAVLDELISVFPERINLFCERIKKYNLKWMAQMRVDSVNQDTINMLKDAGCIQISYGIEHVNQAILENYNKKTTLKQIESALEMTYAAGIGIQGNILLGGPAETDATIEEAIAWAAKNKKYMLNLTAVIPYPGTDLFYYGVKHGYINAKRFIEEGCPFVNFAGVQIRMPAFFNFGKLIDERMLCKDQYRGEISELTAECPHCHAQPKYPGVYWGSTGIAFTSGQSYRIGCRSCNQRFDIK